MLIKAKIPKKETVLHEAKEALSIVLYLTIAFSVIATFKALVLFQLDINEFLHLYFIALIEALIIGKIVVIAQKLPLMNICDQYPLIWPVLYKSVILTMLIDIADFFEDTFFASSIHHLNPPRHPLVFWITHQILSLSVFFLLYIVRGLDRKLGSGKLLQLLIKK